jgi:hypothetical protein
MVQQIKRISGGSSVRIDVEKLSAIGDGFGQKLATQVGILGAKAHNRKEAGAMKKGGGHKITRDPSELTNAEIGLKHEKGSFSENIPRRSFLEMPLVTKANALLRIKDYLWRQFETGKRDYRTIYKQLGYMAEVIIQRAFATRGFGTWRPNSARTIEQKGSDAPLIDTAQLRRSVTSRVVTR